MVTIYRLTNTIVWGIFTASDVPHATLKLLSMCNCVGQVSTYSEIVLLYHLYTYMCVQT